MHNNAPTLYVFSGLPGVGKTSLAKRLAARLHAVYLRIDTVEQGLRDLCRFNVQGEGYRLSYRIAADNILLGNDVVADSCNPIRLTRQEWAAVASESGAACINIHVTCSDPAIHEERVNERTTDIATLRLPTWEEVQQRAFDDWQDADLTIDTSGRTEEQSFAELVVKTASLSV